MGVRRAAVVGALCLSALAALAAQTSPRAIYLSHAQASPIFAALNETTPPVAGWQRWIATADAATRARVAEGDETTIVNLLLFGTSFTTQPRITSGQLNREHIQRAVSVRLDDFETALASADMNERLQLARRVLRNSRQSDLDCSR